MAVLLLAGIPDVLDKKAMTDFQGFGATTAPAKRKRNSKLRTKAPTILGQCRPGDIILIDEGGKEPLKVEVTAVKLASSVWGRDVIGNERGDFRPLGDNDLPCEAVEWKP